MSLYCDPIIGLIIKPVTYVLMLNLNVKILSDMESAYIISFTLYLPKNN